MENVDKFSVTRRDHQSCLTQQNEQQRKEFILLTSCLPRSNRAEENNKGSHVKSF